MLADFSRFSAFVCRFGSVFGRFLTPSSRPGRLKSVYDSLTAVLFPSLPPGRSESVYEVSRRFCFLPDVMIMLLIVSACSEIMQDYMLLIVSSCSELMYDYMTNSYLEF